MKGFWKEFVSGNNSVVHSPTVIVAFISIILATPIVLLAITAFIYHAFYHHRGLDEVGVKLLLGLLAAATGGLGAGLMSRFAGGAPPVLPGDGIGPKTPKP